MFDVLTIGDTFSDAFLRPNDSHFSKEQIRLSGNKLCLRHGDKISVDEIKFSLGGSACNVAIGLKKLGFNTAMLSAVGTDEQGQKILEKIADFGVETKFIKQIPKMISNYSAIIVYKNERTVLLYRGLKDYSKLNVPKKIRARWVYVGPVAESFSVHYTSLITQAAENGLKIVINPGHRQIQKGKTELKKIIRVAKILILNKQEALDLTGLPPLNSEKKILRGLMVMGPQIVVMTDGENGAFVNSNDEMWHIPILKIKTVDPTGAGDAFSSGFLGNYIVNNDLKLAMQYGILNSAAVAEQYGAQANLLDKNQIEKLLSDAPELYKI